MPEKKFQNGSRRIRPTKARPCVGAAAAFSVALATGGPATGQEISGTTWDGIFTEEQVVRGMEVFAKNCVQCHAETMRGGPGAPTLVGPGFLFVWDGKTVLDLYTLIHQTMPPNRPGSLSDREYVDVTAAILAGNDFPAGDMELQPDPEALAAYLISRSE